MQVGNCVLTRFWGDSWCGVSHVKDMFSELYINGNERIVTVVVVAANGNERMVM
jgi:hypothetical protein